MANIKTTNCPGCAGKIHLDEETKLWSAKGPHHPDCIIKNYYETLSTRDVTNHKRGKWRVNVNAPDGIEYTKPEPAPTPPPVSTQQFTDNVINVDFKNKKRI